MLNQTDDKSLRCAFCGKSQNEVELLIAGPGVNICNECVAIFDEIVKAKKQSEAVK